MDMSQIIYPKQVVSLKSNMAWRPLINIQKSVFLPLWDNHELYGCKMLLIESFLAEESENLVRIAKFFI